MLLCVKHGKNAIFATCGFGQGNGTGRLGFWLEMRNLMFYISERYSLLVASAGHVWDEGIESDNDNRLGGWIAKGNFWWS